MRSATWVIGCATIPAMAKLVEWVPNFGGGRRPAVLARLREAIERTPGAHFLDQTADIDHHRSVITFAGESGPGPGPLGAAGARPFLIAYNINLRGWARVPALDFAAARGDLSRPHVSAQALGLWLE